MLNEATEGFILNISELINTKLRNYAQSYAVSFSYYRKSNHFL